MIDGKDRLYFAMLREPFCKVRTAFIQLSRVEHDRVLDSRLWMEEQGYEEHVVSSEALLTDDGREIVRAHGRAWALQPEVHAKYLAEIIASGQRPATPVQPPLPATCTALIDSQLCGGTLAHTPVCPRCVLGKQGVAATLTCDVCGHVTAIMREAK